MTISNAEIDDALGRIDTATPEERPAFLATIAQWKDQDAMDRQQKVEKIFTDPEKWGGQWTPERQALIEQSIDPGDTKQAMANTAWIAHQEDKDPYDIADFLPAYRKAYAQKYFGKQDMSNSEFSAAVGETVKGDRARRSGKRDLLGDVALSKFEELATGVTRSIPEFVSSYKKENPDFFAGLSDEDEVKVLSALSVSASDLAEKFDKHAPLAKKLFEYVTALSGQSKDGKAITAKPPQLSDVASSLIDMPRADRNALYGAVLLAAKRKGLDPKTVLGQIGESVVRSSYGAAGQITRVLYEDTLRDQNFKLKNNIPEVSLEQQQPGLPIGVIPVARPSIAMSEEEKAQTIAGNETTIKSLEIFREISNLAEQSDPIEVIEKSMIPALLQKGAYGVGSSLPLLAVAAVPYIGPATAFAAYYSSNSERIALESPDLDPNLRRNLAMAQALPEALMDRFQMNMLTGKAPTFIRLLKDMKASKAGAVGFAKQWTKNTVNMTLSETAIELPQNFLPLITDQIGMALSKDYAKHDFSEDLKQWAAAAPETLMTMFLISLVGGGVAGYRDIKNGAVLIKNTESLRWSGFTEEHAAKIAAEPTAEAAQEKLRELYKERTPESIAEGVKLANEAAAKIRADANKPGPKITTETNGDGNLVYQVRRRDGSIVDTTTSQTSANLMLRELRVNEMTQTTRGIAESVEWVNRISEAKARGEDVAKLILEETPGRNLFADYEANPTEANLQRLYETVRNLGKEINTPEELKGYWVQASNNGWIEDRVYKSLIRINVNYASGISVLRDEAQRNFKQALAEKRFTIEWAREQLNAIIPLIDSSRIKRKLRTETDTDVIESFSDIAVAYLRGVVKEEQIPTGLRGFLRGLSEMMREIFRRSYRLHRLRAEGKLDTNLEAAIADSIGLNSQARVDTARESTSSKIDGTNYSVSSSAMPDADRTGANYSISAAQDSRFLELAKDPDANREELQRMVDEAARAAGYLTKVWHSSTGEAWTKTKGSPIYLSTDKQIAEWATQVKARSLYTNLSPDEIKKFPKWSLSMRGGQDAIAKKLAAQGYAAAEAVMYPFRDKKQTEILLSDPTGRIKSADLVTYDAAGNVIPLSERFNQASDNINYSISELRKDFKNTSLVTVDHAAAMLGNFPAYLNEVVEFMKNQRAKAVAGTFNKRDIAKAYLITIGSIGASAQTVETFEKNTGLTVPDKFKNLDNGKWKIRPEEAVAFWFSTPEGQAALDAIDAGNATPDGLQELLRVRDSFGRNDIRNNAMRIGGNKRTISDISKITDEINAAKGDVAKIDEIASSLSGIGSGKLGFIKHLLGFGDSATIDAVEINFWITGKGSTSGMESKRADLVRRIKDEGGSTFLGEVADRLSNQINRLAGRYGIEEEYAAHVIHHWVWDAAKKIETTHEGMMDSMANYSISVQTVASNILADRLNVPGNLGPEYAGRQMIPIEADMTAGGGSFTKKPAQGGPAWSVIKENFDAGVAWAAAKDGFWTGKLNAARENDAIFIGKDGREKFLVATYAMGQDSHISNPTVAGEKFGEVSRYIAEKRISAKQAKGIAKFLKDGAAKGLVKAKEELAAAKAAGNKKAAGKALAKTTVFEAIGRFPDSLTSNSFDTYLASLSFEQRAYLGDRLSSAEAEKLGVPPMGQIRRATLDESFAGTQPTSLISILEIDVKRLEDGLKNKTLTAEAFGVTPHNSYESLAPGTPVAFFRTPIPYALAFPDMRAALYGAGYNTNHGYMLKGKMPTGLPRTQTISAQMISDWGDVQTSLRPNQAKAIVTALNQGWNTYTKAGQAGLAKFPRAILNNDAAVTLTPYSLDDVKKMLKAGTMKIYQLGDMDVWFALKRPDPEEGDAGDPQKDWHIVSVASNEKGAPGMLPLIMSKAIAEGGTHLDCFSVKSAKFPGGLLPTLYARSGFEETSVSPFDPKYHKAPGKMGELEKVWASQKWDGQEKPPLVYMKWNPTLHANLGPNADASGAIDEKRTAQANGRSMAGRPDPGVGGNAGEASVGMGGAGEGLQGGGLSDGASATGSAGDARNILPRGIEQEVADLGKLNDYQLQALGLTRAEVDSAIKVYSDPNSVNYSISTSAEIDSVNSALDGMNRGPDSRLDVYNRAKWVFGNLLKDNQDILATIKATDVPDSTPALDAIEADRASKQVDLQAEEELEVQQALSDNADTFMPRVEKAAEGADRRKVERDAADRAKIIEKGIRDKFKERRNAIDEAAKVETEKVEAMVKAMTTIGDAKLKGTMRHTKMLQAIGELDAILSVLPAEVRGRVGGYSTLANVGTGDRALAKFFAARIGMIDKELERVLSRDYREAILKALKSSRPKRGGSGARKSTLGPGAQEYADRVYRATLLDNDATAARMQVINEGIATASPEARIDLAEEWGILNTFGDLENRNADTLARGLEELRETLKAGRDAWRIKEQDRINGQRERAGKVVDALGAAGKVGRFKDKKQLQKIIEGVTAAGLDHASFEQFIHAVIQDEQVAKEWSAAMRKSDTGSQDMEIKMQKDFVDALNAAAKIAGMSTGRAVQLLKTSQPSSVRALEGRLVTDEKISVEIAEKIVRGAADPSHLTKEDVENLREELAMRTEFLAERDFDSMWKGNDNAPLYKGGKYIVLKRVISQGFEVKVDMTPAQGIQMLLSWNQPDVQEKMRREGWSDQSIADIEDLTKDPVSQGVLAYLKDFYANAHKVVNPVYAGMFGMNMPQVKLYAPSRFLHSKDSNEVGLDGSPVMSGSLPSFTKSRVSHSNPIAPADALTVFQQHVMQTAHWVHFAEFAREVRAITANTDVREAIRQNAGAGALASMDTWVELIEQRGANKSRESAWLNYVLSSLIGGRAISALGFNLKSILMQQDSALRFLLQTNLREVGSALANPSQLAADMPKVWNSPAIQRRLLGGMSPEVKFLFSQYATNPGVMGNIAHTSMIPMQYFDAAATTLSSAIVYRAKYNEVIEAGLGEVEAERQALDAVEEVVYRFSQPTGFGSKSIIENTGSPERKALLMFMSDPRLKSAVMLNAVRDIAAGKNVGMNIQRLVVIEAMSLLSHLIGCIYRDLFTDDDDVYAAGGFARAFFLAPLQGYIFLGTLSEVTLSKIMGEGFFMPSQNPVLDTANSAYRAVRNWDKAFQTEDPGAFYKEWVNILRAIAFTPSLGAAAALANIIKPFVGAAQNAQTEE